MVATNVRTPSGSRKRRILRRLLIGCGGGSTSIVLLLALIAQHRPAWYAPGGSGAAELDEAREQAALMVDSIGDQMVRGQPFDVACSESVANAWLSTVLHDRSDVAERIPANFHAPALGFRGDSVRIGARFEGSGWRAVLSAAGRVTVSADGAELIVSLQGLAIGSLSLPLWMWPAKEKERRTRAVEVGDQRTVIDLEFASGEDLSDLSPRRLAKGIRLKNRFVWPNGRRPFRVLAATAADGVLRIRIEPL